MVFEDDSDLAVGSLGVGFTEFLCFTGVLCLL